MNISKENRHKRVVMMLLILHGNIARNISDLAAQMKMSREGMVAVIKQAVEMGYIEKKFKQMPTITEAGMEAINGYVLTYTSKRGLQLIYTAGNGKPLNGQKIEEGEGEEYTLPMPQELMDTHNRIGERLKEVQRG